MGGAVGEEGVGGRGKEGRRKRGMKTMMVMASGPNAPLVQGKKWMLHAIVAKYKTHPNQLP